LEKLCVGVDGLREESGGDRDGGDPEPPREFQE
jgi:hypothetical protein